MRNAIIQFATIITLLAIAPSSHSQPSTPPHIQLTTIGRYAVTTTRVPANTEVRIRVSQKADFTNCGIVLVALKEDEVKGKLSMGQKLILAAWSPKEVATQPVMICTVPQTLHVGVGLQGFLVNPSNITTTEDGYYRVSFSTFSETMTLEIRFVEPEF
jgi:hypothetical protein